MNMTGPEGLVFSGRYRIENCIGKGGMALVYLATDLSTGMKVAVKVLKENLCNDEKFVERFNSEAKAASILQHNNIVRVFDVGHEGIYRYIVEEYVEGITLKDLINQNGHLDWKVAVPIVIQIGMALDYAHRKGIVHRDIKPQNILITRDRVAKITDFGIARNSATTNTITMHSGGILGTVHYLSPEQAGGRQEGPSSDIYSIGVMLYEMITGRCPFVGETAIEVAMKHLKETPQAPSSMVPGIPSGLDSIILKCMQKAPERRYSTMLQMVQELDNLLLDPNGQYGVITQAPVADESTEVVNTFRQRPSYDKVSDIEHSIEARRRARLRDNTIFILIILLIVGVLLGLGALIINTIRGASTIEANNDYTVKNYVGLTIDEVLEELDKNNINYQIEYELREDYAPGIVIEQSINEGVVISSGSSVSRLVITVSTAEETVALPNYTGLDFEDAYQSLVSQGYLVSVRTEVNEDVEPNSVIRTEPAAGTPLSVGASVVIIYAVEPTSCTVPQISGLTLEEAREVIAENNLVIGQIDGAPEVISLPENQQIVLLTDPGEGVTVPRRSSIKIYVGTMEDFINGGTPTPTPSQINVSAGVIGSGTVSGNGIYPPDTTVVLTAIPAEGYKFDYWQDAAGNIISYEAQFSFVCTPTTSAYTAVFSVLPTSTPTPTMTPTPSPSPSPSPSPIPTATPVPTATSTPVPVATATPVPPSDQSQGITPEGA